MMGITMTEQRMKTVRTGAVVLGLVLLPGLASFIQQQLLQRKMMRLDLPQAGPPGSTASSSGRGESDRSFTKLGFDTLKSWTYVEGKTPIPDFIKKLDGKDIEMTGFMMPLSEVNDITEFLLVPSLWGCCYGQPPAVNHIVVVKMPAGRLAKFYNDPIRVRGRFNVGETKQDGYLVSLYVLTAERIDGQ